MDGPTLSKAMGGVLSASRYAALAPATTAALAQADCTTVERAAMFLAQVGHESLGLRYAEEIASGAAYEGRTDLGNTRKGDGTRYKGRSFIQVTGRANYTKLSAWAYGKGLVPTATYFVDNPTALASDQYAWLGAVWYWTVARRMNAFADAGDITGATRAVNGGLNGIADRTARWAACRALGSALLSGLQPCPVASPSTASTGEVPASLREGDTGPRVARLQAWLNATFPAYSHIDLGPQRYGPQTVAVVAEFQRRTGVTGADADGTLIGPRTWRELLREGYRP